MSDQKLIKLEVTYGATRYMVNLYGTRIGKIYGRFLDRGKPIWIKLEAGTEIHTAVKKKALELTAEYKQERKKK